MKRTTSGLYCIICQLHSSVMLTNWCLFFWLPLLKLLIGCGNARTYLFAPNSGPWDLHGKHLNQCLSVSTVLCSTLLVWPSSTVSLVLTSAGFLHSLHVKSLPLSLWAVREWSFIHEDRSSATVALDCGVFFDFFFDTLMCCVPRFPPVGRLSGEGRWSNYPRWGGRECG